MTLFHHSFKYQQGLLIFLLLLLCLCAGCASAPSPARGKTAMQAPSPAERANPPKHSPATRTTPPLKQPMRMDPAKKSSLLQKAKNLTRSGQSKDAQTLLKQAIAEFPSEPALYFQLGLSCIGSGNNEEAAAVFKDMARNFPLLPEPHNNLASLYLAQNKLDLAEEALTKALQLRPGYPRAIENLTTLYLTRTREALEVSASDGTHDTEVQAKLERTKQLLLASKKAKQFGSTTSSVTEKPIKNLPALKPLESFPAKNPSPTLPTLQGTAKSTGDAVAPEASVTTEPPLEPPLTKAHVPAPPSLPTAPSTNEENSESPHQEVLPSVTKLPSSPTSDQPAADLDDTGPDLDELHSSMEQQGTHNSRLEKEAVLDHPVKNEVPPPVSTAFTHEQLDQATRNTRIPTGKDAGATREHVSPASTPLPLTQKDLSEQAPSPSAFQKDAEPGTDLPENADSFASRTPPSEGKKGDRPSSNLPVNAAPPDSITWEDPRQNEEIPVALPRTEQDTPPGETAESQSPEDSSALPTSAVSEGHSLRGVPAVHEDEQSIHDFSEENTVAPDLAESGSEGALGTQASTETPIAQPSEEMNSDAPQETPPLSAFPFLPPLPPIQLPS